MDDKGFKSGYIPELIAETAAIYNRVFGTGGGPIRASKDWRPNMAPRRRQGWWPFCVSYSRVACALAVAAVSGVTIDLSRLVLGVLSGTGGPFAHPATPSGNSLENVSETFRKIGDVLSSIRDFTDKEITYSGQDVWDNAFNLPAAVAAAKKYLGGSHSWVFGRAAQVDALDHSPLQIACPIGETWENDGIVQPPKVISDYHSPTLCFIDANGVMYIQDTIGKEWKQLSPDYPLTGTKSFRDLPENWKELNMGKILGIQFGTDKTIYVQVGNSLQLVPCADWNAFVNIGGSADSIVPFPAESKVKFQIVTHDLFKSE